jgi:hypothetical protein
VLPGPSIRIAAGAMMMSVLRHECPPMRRPGNLLPSRIQRRTQGFKSGRESNKSLQPIPREASREMRLSSTVRWSREL